ncbi:hypothetical protein TWF718_000098 [Orbilia javanica]|uniref:C2H2-type domain-containing protein n=1 Tax=Orbilia javanica TaxID=47235 RepID=A0AAN8P0P6_9PEZI
MGGLNLDLLYYPLEADPYSICPNLPVPFNQLDFSLYHLWLANFSYNHQDDASNRQVFAEAFLEPMRITYYSSPYIADLGTAPHTHEFYNRSLSPQSAFLNADVTFNPPGIFEGAVADFPVIPPPLPSVPSAILFPPDSPPPLSPPPSSSTLSSSSSLSPPPPPPPSSSSYPIYMPNESIEIQPEPASEGNVTLSRADLAPYIQMIGLHQAMKNRAKRQNTKKAPRSKSKLKADQNRIKENESGVKPRKDRVLCPEPGCSSEWSNQKNLQNHLGGHDIRFFVCMLCNADFPRRDNAINHLRTTRRHDGFRERILATKNSENQSETNSQSSGSLFPHSPGLA